MSATKVSPAPVDVPPAKQRTARGIKTVLAPAGESNAIQHPAQEDVPSSTSEALAILDTAKAQQIALSPAPETDATAVRPSAQEIQVPPAPIELTQAAEWPAQGIEVPPVVQAMRGSQEKIGDGWIELRVWAEMLFDAQRARIACTNRIERGGIDSAYFKPQLATLIAAEHEFALSLRECYRRTVPASIRAWQRDAVGIGAPALARLLGHLGDPSTRSLRQLWSYCGHGDAERKRRKGMTQDEAKALGSPMCKMIVHQLLASSCIKFMGEAKRRRSPYRDVYDWRREVTVDREDWTAGHQHNDALRITGKEILRDLWIASHQTASAA